MLSNRVFVFKGLLVLASFFAFQTSAEVIVNSSSFQPVSGQSTTTMQQVGGTTTTDTKYNLTEGGFQMSSLNDGTLSATIALIHEFENGVGVGVRGAMPMQFTSETQVYTGSFLARFMLLNEMNKMFLEPALSMGVYNGETNSNAFWLAGMTFGYLRELNRDFSIGGNIGVDYSNRRVSENGFYTSASLYNKIGVIGNYYF